jgi:endonuclease/exonuclease/phosphatase (EEP) superfamily protein YafD
LRRRDLALAGVCLLLAPAAVLTLCRLIEPPWATTVQAVAFTPFAIPLYAATLLLVVAVTVVRRTVAVPYAVIAGLAITGLVVHAWWFAPLVTGDGPAAGPDAEPTVVMTANVLRGRADGADLMDQVREHDVGLLVVNEITGSSLAAMEAEDLDILLPFREGRPGAEDGVGGTMVFSDQPTEPVDVLDTKLGAVVVETGGLRLIAVHPKAPVWPEDWRDDHAKVLAAVETHDPDLVMGDFNATLDHGPMRALEDAGYRDSVELTNGGYQPTWPVTGRFGAYAQIDHVLVSDDWTVTEMETAELDGSDHKPVIATVARR